MTGPVAPRDPEKARAHFYIMRGKEICGLKQGDGKAVQFIYESDGPSGKQCTDCRKYHG